MKRLIVFFLALILGISFLLPNRVLAAKPAYDYQLIYQSPYPVTLIPGEVANVWIEVKNTGTATWWQNVRLGSGSSYGSINQQRDYPSEFTAPTWRGSNRPTNIYHPEVRPGWHTRFQFDIQAPATPGTYRAYFTPVVDGVAWMKDIGIYWQITVSGTSATQKPATPTNLQADNTLKNTISLSWDSVNGVTSYDLRRYEGVNLVDAVSKNPIVIYTGAQANYVDTGLTAGKLYLYEVRANNAYGSSEYSAIDGRMVYDHDIPTITSLSLNPSIIYQGESTTVTWQTKNVITCVLDNYVNGEHSFVTVNSSGSKTYSNIPAIDTYMLLCYDNETNLPDTVANLFSDKYLYSDLDKKLFMGDGNDVHYAYEYFGVDVRNPAYYTIPGR